MLNSAKRAPVSHLRRRALALGPAAALLAFPAFLFVQSGCGSDDEEPTGGCTPGAQQSCPAAGCNDGVQTCAPDGASFEPCICPSATGAGGSNMGAGGSSMGAGGSNMGAGGMGGMTMTGIGGGAMPGQPAPFTGATGSPCENDTDCFGGMTCLSEFPIPIGPGQVTGGYCTMPCASIDDCQAVDAVALCPDAASNDGTRYCVGLCGLNAEPRPVCGINRIDMACIPAGGLPEEIGICAPRCLDDESCGAGLFCDLGSGLCQPKAPPGAAVGAACVEGDTCASGVCLASNPEEDEVGFCGGVCTLGLIPGCGFGVEVAAGERGAACFFPAAPTGNGGLCAALCDQAADCEGEGFVCDTDAFDEQDAAVFGRAGICLPARLLGEGADAGAPPPGGDGSADAGVAAN